jgi:hypothetical protein
VTAPPLDWIGEARALLTAADASVDRVADWLGGGVERGEDGLRAAEGAIPGANSVTVLAENGALDALMAWYPGTSGPTLGEAEAALGEARELPRLTASPPQVAFPPYRGEAATCFIGATTWDPPTDGAARRLFQLTLRRDPLQGP